MKKLRLASLVCYFIVLFISCSTKNIYNEQSKGRIVTRKKECRKENARVFLDLSLFDAKDEKQKIDFSMFTINGLFFPIKDSTFRVQLYPGKYKIEAYAFNFEPIVTTIKIEQGNDVFLDFYLEYDVKYLKK